MFIILLRFAEYRHRAPDHMQGHADWIRRGFDEGVFLLVGSLRENQGGAIVAQHTAFEALQMRVNEDPFVAEKVVTAEILEIAPDQADARLEFLLDRPVVMEGDRND